MAQKSKKPARNNRNPVASMLEQVLANSFVLYFKTHACHWNVTGPNFHGLHVMLEEQYKEIWTATDDIAERIRSLGEIAPTTFAELISEATIEESTGLTGAKQMITTLLKDHEEIEGQLAKAIKLAQDEEDEGTADLLVNRAKAHAKMAWMLRSHLEA